MRCPTLSELPSPPSDKTGWPWTEASDSLPDLTLQNAEWPTISIVTPSYNQGAFIEETIRSVLLQGYPNLEYIIIDGGSNDNTIEIIQKYSQWISYWVSEPDRGQANAVNKGMSHATGSILNFLNSDDFLLPGAVALTAQILLQKTKDLAISYGFRLRIDRFSQVVDFELSTKQINRLAFRIGNWIPSETCFFTREVFDAVNGFNEKLHFALDYDFNIRSLKIGTKFYCIEEFIGAMRFHDSSKSLTIGEIGMKEFLMLREEVFGNDLNSKIANWMCDCFISKVIFHKNKYKRSIWKYLNDGKLNVIKQEPIETWH